MINGVEYERPYKWGELGIANHQWQAPKWMNGILDKIGEFGMDSLLQEEIEFLKGIK